VWYGLTQIVTLEGLFCRTNPTIILCDPEMTQALGTSALHYQELRYHPQTGQRQTTKKKKKKYNLALNFNSGEFHFLNQVSRER
jgi:hypothetical protein